MGLEELKEIAKVEAIAKLDILKLAAWHDSCSAIDQKKIDEFILWIKNEYQDIWRDDSGEKVDTPKPPPPPPRYIKESDGDIPINSAAYRICMRNCPFRKRGNREDLKADIIQITEEERKRTLKILKKD